MRARSALFTLFGDFVRPAGGEAWLRTLTGCMGALGFTPEATRTALHRMAAEGWVEPRRAGRYAAYRMTPRGVDRLEEAARRIYRLRAEAWDRHWRVLVAPAAGRSADAGKELRWVGFGRLSPDTWVSPHPHGDRVPALLDRHDLGGQATLLLAAATDDDAAIVAQAWDLSELAAAHREFLQRWQGAAVPGDRAAAFTARVHLVHHWRGFLFLDPGLPDALLPDAWLGPDAARCFRVHYEALSPAAWAHYEDLAVTTPVHQPAMAGSSR